MREAVKKAAEAVQYYINEDIDFAMNRLNRKEKAEKAEKKDSEVQNQ